MFCLQLSEPEQTNIYELSAFLYLLPHHDIAFVAVYILFNFVTTKNDMRNILFSLISGRISNLIKYL